MDWYTCIEIKSQPLKSFAYWGIIIGTLCILIWNSLLLSKNQKILGIVLPLGIIVYLIACSNPLTVLFRSGTWKTQTIEYESKDKNRTIEYQMQDIGVFGFNRRTVEVKYITPWFMIVGYPKDNPVNNTEWTRVNTDINELELK